MSNIANLRKQAKQFVRWHRERHWPVAEQIRATLPAFRELSDREIFETAFQLADAQELVSLRAGAASWAELKAGAEGGVAAEGSVRTGERVEVSSADSTDEVVTGPALSGVQPFLFVADVVRSCDYYRDILGFDVRFTYGEPPFYGEVERGPVALSVRQVDGYILEAQRTRRAEEELLVATINTPDIKLLYQECVDVGAAFYQTLRTEPWGQKSFIVEDPDANLIAFSQPADA